MADNKKLQIMIKVRSFNYKLSDFKKIYNWLGMGISSRSQHFHQHTALFKEGRGMHEHMKMGQEEPNQHIYGRCSISNTEFSRGTLDLYPKKKHSWSSGKRTLC